MYLWKILFEKYLLRLQRLALHARHPPLALGTNFGQTMPETKCKHPLCPEHTCCLGGLWWSDEEFGPAVEALWHEYVERMHEWQRYETEVATALGHLLRVSARERPDTPTQREPERPGCMVPNCIRLVTVDSEGYFNSHCQQCTRLMENSW